MIVCCTAQGWIIDAVMIQEEINVPRGFRKLNLKAATGDKKEWYCDLEDETDYIREIAASAAEGACYNLPSTRGS